MPDYAAQIEPRDRWAIVAYVRVLQLSQHASLADVPPEKRGELNKEERSNAGRAHERSFAIRRISPPICRLADAFLVVGP